MPSASSLPLLDHPHTVAHTRPFLQSPHLNETRPASRPRCPLRRTAERNSIRQSSSPSQRPLRTQPAQWRAVCAPSPKPPTRRKFPSELALPPAISRETAENESSARCATTNPRE